MLHQVTLRRRWLEYGFKDISPLAGLTGFNGIKGTELMTRKKLKVSEVDRVRQPSIQLEPFGKTWKRNLRIVNKPHASHG